MEDNNPRKYRRNLPGQTDIFPQTKVGMRKKPVPVSQRDPNVIRLKFLERPFRFYHSLSYHWQAFGWTVLMSFLLIVPAYNLVYLFARKKSQAEILGKMDVEFTSDNLKQQIIDFKRREKLGQIERYEGSQA